MNENVVDEVVKVVFVSSAENDSYILKKNLSANLHEKNSKIIGAWDFYQNI